MVKRCSRRGAGDLKNKREPVEDFGAKEVDVDGWCGGGW